MKKLISLVLALAMIMMVGAVYAADVDPEPAASAPTLPTGDLSITNLEAGDHVDLYKIVGWNTTTSNWQLLISGMPEAYDTVEEIVAALGNANANACAAAIAAHLPATKENQANIDSTKTYTYEDAEVGLYYAAVTSGTEAIMYNPMVLAVNFDYSTNPAGGVDGSISATQNLGNTIIAKKQPVTLTKEVNDTDPMNDVAVGDTIPFKVTTAVPNYGANFVSPEFKIYDELSTGLTMTAKQQGEILVKNGDTTLVKKAENVTEYQYEITPTAQGYTIVFTEAFLKTAKASSVITVEYSATVNALTDMHQFERYDNTVRVEFTNNPGEESKSLEKDTHHYTFSIDALIYGGNSGGDITKELKKIAVDALTGEVITEWTTTEENSWTSRTALEGAHFQLKKDSKVVAECDSGTDGRLTFTGLDADSYMLYETSAPSGYKYSETGVPVVITANYDANGYLTNYTITIAGDNKSTYTVENEGTANPTTVTINDNSKTTGIINEKAVTLPSTGGIGTTIFYILGGLLVVGAAVILIARRKAQD